MAIRLQNELETTMSHHLDSPIARQDIRLSRTCMYFAVRREPYSSSIFAIPSSDRFPRPATILRAFTSLRSI
jgi:hypothetical protein